jgi:hypothetical protein
MGRVDHVADLPIGNKPVGVGFGAVKPIVGLAPIAAADAEAILKLIDSA